MQKEEKLFQVSPSLFGRKTKQFLMPAIKERKANSKFDLYPSHDLGSEKIHRGYDGLVDFIIDKRTVFLDGFSGINWDLIVQNILLRLESKGFSVRVFAITQCLKPENEIEALVSPFLGQEESVWGKRCNLELLDFFDVVKLNKWKIDADADINIVYGPGSSLANSDHSLLYFDLPKNELQYRMRALAVENLGISSKKETFKMYKHYYFIDWVVMNLEKRRLANTIDIIIDGQQEENPTWAYMTNIQGGLKEMSVSAFRVRPWFEPGAWGGEWIKKHIDGLNNDVVNYAWAFSLIVPENGLLFESDGNLLEISFDFLMNQESVNVLGSHQERFGTEFPIRFNFLDTYKGGNLSIQCHPSLQYIKDEFGENITQDECYYILDCEKDASVYLGFQENIKPDQFRAALEKSNTDNIELEITNYVQKHPSQKHELYLIPNGTIHSAGSGNMVLEISATPYIYTFKMYDWLRLDLNGKPRPINIDHAFNNLRFDRNGVNVQKELFSHKKQIEIGDDFEIIHYPTHEEHFYDVRRYDFDHAITRETNGSCQVMMLVEGQKVRLEVNGYCEELNYAETFVVPAAANEFKLTNLSSGRAKVINAYLK